MIRTLSRTLLVAAGVGALFASVPQAVSAQATFTACRVPGVGAIYMIGVEGAPTECLDPAHVEFSWTEGSGTLGDGSVTTAMLQDAAVTDVKIATGAVGTTQVSDNSLTAADLAAGSVTASEIATGAVGTAEIADGTVAVADLVPGVGVLRKTVVTYNGTSTSNPGSSHSQLKVIGSFTKARANTDIEITWNSHVSGSGHCNFQIRVNGVASPTSNFGAVINPGVGNTNYFPVSTTNVWPSLGAGTHQVTIWARGLSTPTCTDNQGNYTRQIIVTEYYPG